MDDLRDLCEPGPACDEGAFNREVAAIEQHWTAADVTRRTGTSTLDDARLFVRSLLVQVVPRTSHESTNGVRTYTDADIPQSDEGARRMLVWLKALLHRIQRLGATSVPPDPDAAASPS